MRSVMNRMHTSMVVMGLFLALAPSSLASTTWYVNGVTGNDSNTCASPITACKTIGHPISLASSGDSIIVAPAIYTENLTINFSLNLVGSGASTTIIDGGGVNRVIYISSGTVTLSGLTIRHGTLAFVGHYSTGGAGIFNSGNLLVIASTITENLVSVICAGGINSCSAAGGGIFNSSAAKVTIRNSTITGNTVRDYCRFSPCLPLADGGGIFNNGTMVMSNTTLAANASYTFGLGLGSGGGAIFNIGTATISNSTLSGNSATFRGGGIYNYQGYSVALQNSIVANSIVGNPLGGNCAGTMTSNGYNISTDSTCAFNNVGDLNNHDPLLGPLQNNGGPTDTMALLPGSPAIDAGNPGGCTDGKGNLLTTDQRGMPRPDQEDQVGCDIGAFESQSD